MLRIAWLPLILLLDSCATSPRLAEPPVIVAHRGALHDAPENTLAAFELAWAQGADRIEGDFYLTRDGEIVAHHDDTTERTAGVNHAVESRTLEELRSLDVGRWKADEWADERIPALEEVLATVPRGRGILIELKSDERIVEPLARIIETCPLQVSQITVITFDDSVLARVIERLPDVAALWVSDIDEDGTAPVPSLDELIATAKRIGADGIDVRGTVSVIDRDYVEAVHTAGLEFHVWTINDVEVARRLGHLGVDSITTDRPGWLRAGITARPHEAAREP